MRKPGQLRRRLLRVLGLVSGCLLVLALLNRIPHPNQVNKTDCTAPTVRIWLVADGWHSGLVLPTDHPRWHWWETFRTHASYPYTEVGWGEEDYYPNPQFSVSEALEALFWANGAVLHVTHYTAPPRNSLPIDLCEDAYLALCRGIAASLADTTALPQPGLYGRESRFYPAQGTYWCLGNCHGWTASQLRLAGIPTPWLCTVGSSVRYYVPLKSTAGP